MLTTTKFYRLSLYKNHLKQNINIFSIEVIRSVEWLNCFFFINKSYNFVIYLVFIFLVYFTKCCQSMSWFYLQKIRNQLEEKRSKSNSGGLCKYHMTSQTSINVNWKIQQASMLCKRNMSSQICCTKKFLDEHSNMLELVQWVFLPWGTQENWSPNSFAYGQ